jgi:hypothetical protein
MKVRHFSQTIWEKNAHMQYRATTSPSYIQGSHCPMKKFNISTLEYETTTLVRNIGHRHPLTLRHIPEERAVIEFHSVFQEVRQGCSRDNVCPSE